MVPKIMLDRAYSRASMTCRRYIGLKSHHKIKLVPKTEHDFDLCKRDVEHSFRASQIESTKF